MLFLRNIFDSTLYALGTRLFTDILPSHKAKRFSLEGAEESFHLNIAGPGSAPDLLLDLVSGTPDLPAPFRGFFDSWNAAVEFLCLQDAAVTAIEHSAHLAYAEIDLPIDPTTVEPLQATHCAPGELLRAWGADASPFCFRVPAVRFRAFAERLVSL